ncbi:hypothetical protein BDZ88DRAFT_488719 [Geranomyces variabilis]|nr:hypothetical protein BDZ88DRAFT_488719 [Geranomyces variabilis]
MPPKAILTRNAKIEYVRNRLKDGRLTPIGYAKHIQAQKLDEHGTTQDFKSILAYVVSEGFANCRGKTLDCIEATRKINENYNAKGTVFRLPCCKINAIIYSRIRAIFANVAAGASNERWSILPERSTLSVVSATMAGRLGWRSATLIRAIIAFHIIHIQYSNPEWATYWIERSADAAMLGQAARIQAASGTLTLTEFIESQMWSTTTLSAFTDKFMLGGIRDVWEDVTGMEDPVEINAASRDADVRYIVKCLQAMAAYISKYAQCPLGERPFDAQAALAFAEVPGVPKLTYGDMMSTSDQSEKMKRSGAARRGKNVDFLYTIAEREHGCAENSGPGARPHLKHAKGDYLSLAKTSRAQIRQLIAHRPAVADKIIVPSFHILDREVLFYVTAQFSPELYVIHEVFEQSLRFPREDSDVQDVLNLTANAMRGSQPHLRTRRLSGPVQQSNAIAGKETPVKKKKASASGASKDAGSSSQAGGKKKKAKTQD